MTNTITLTENENTLLEMTRAADNNGKEFILKSVLCAVRYGDEFFNDTQKHVAQKNGCSLREIVEHYISRLESEEL